MCGVDYYLNVLEPLLPEYRKKDALLSALLSILNLMESGDQTDPFFQVHLLKLLKKAYKDSDNPEFAVTLNSWGASKIIYHDEMVFSHHRCFSYLVTISAGKDGKLVSRIGQVTSVCRRN